MVKVKVRYFAFVKDVTGKTEEVIDTNCKDVDCLVAELKTIYGKRFADIIDYGKSGVKVVVLVDGQSGAKELHEGSEVAIFPPPSGGEIVHGEVNLLEEIRKFMNRITEEVGSLVVYTGIIKGIVEGHRVSELKYEAYEEYTKRRFEEIKRELKEKYKDLVDIEIVHGISDFKPGQTVFVVMALGKGRKDTIDAVKEAVELVKNTTGIWKLEVRDDGEFWVVAGNTRVKKE